MFIPTTTLTQGGGVMALISDETLLVDTATFDVQNISPGYRHLQLIIQFRTTEAIIISNAITTFNNDGGANYDLQADRGRDVTSSATDAQASATGVQLITPGASAAAGVFSSQVMVIPNYAGTVAEKSGHSTGGFVDEAATGGHAGVYTYHWRNTATINRITITANSASNFLTGSRLTIYGL